MIITDEKLLRVKCEDVLPDEVQELKRLLELELDNSAKNGLPGVGLAAPQIGIAKKMAIIRVSEKYHVDIVNARIKQGFNKSLFNGEGCLSFPGRYEKTMRFQEIQVVDNLIYPYSFIARGLFAAVIAHEIDHLNGKILPDFALKQIQSNKVRPNDPCSCGSGKKYKKCCAKR